MSGKTSGASARAHGKSTTKNTATKNSKGAKKAKSVKADGTPKQRWTAAERRESGRPPRRSAGRQYGDSRQDGGSRSDGRYDSRDSDNRGYGARNAEGRGYQRNDRNDRPRTDRPRTDRYERSDRPAYQRDDRADRPKSGDRFERNERPGYQRNDRDRRAERGDRYERTDRYERGDRYERTDRNDRYQRSDRNDRPAYNADRNDRSSYGHRDRANDRSRERYSDDRPQREDRPRQDRPSYDRARDDRPRYDRAGVDRPRYDRAGVDRPRRDDRSFSDRPYGDRAHGDRPRQQDRRFEDRPRFERGARRHDDRPVSGAPESDQMSWEAPSEDLTVATTSAPVPSTGGFADLGLPKALVAALQAGGITEPFPIQAATIPDALAGRDVLGRGKTGSGKTLGFGLPMITTLAGSNAPSGCARALVLVPTRELALQVADVLAPLARIEGLSLTLVAGGMAYGPQLKAFERGVDIVVATPGRLIDLMDQGAADLTRVEVVVLDEADHMADLGFMPAVTQILDTVPAGGQRLLFSATLDSAVNRLVKRYLVDPVTHEVDPGQASNAAMEHHVLLVRPADKARLTAEIAGRDGRTVVFVRTQLGANRVAEQLREAGVLAGALHGGLTQGARARMLAAFKDGRLPVLVATDVAARGIHVDEVGLVLQVDPPAGPKDYLHRAGRTARAGETGVVVTLALPHQRRDIERLTRQAGVQTAPFTAEPGDAYVGEATGAQAPTGVAVSQQEFDKLVAPPARQAKRRPGQGHRASRGGYRGGSAGRRPRS